MTTPAGKIIKFHETIVIRAEGMPIYRRPDEKGDLYVVFQIEMPNEEWRASVNVQVYLLFFLKCYDNLLYFRLLKRSFLQNASM